MAGEETTGGEAAGQTRARRGREHSACRARCAVSPYRRLLTDLRLVLCALITFLDSSQRARNGWTRRGENGPDSLSRSLQVK